METGGVGICVSGGGIRSAAFGLGALQALQDKAGLLRGPHAADYLSAVSGGSYIAACYTQLNASNEFGGSTAFFQGKPLAPGTYETDHLRQHCRYLVEDGGLLTTARFVGLAIVNVITLVFTVALAGALLAFVAWVVGFPVPDSWYEGEAHSIGWAIGVTAAVVGAGVLLWAVRRNQWSWGSCWWLIPVLVFCSLGLPFLATSLPGVRACAYPGWWLDHIQAVGVTVAGVAAAGFVLLIARGRLRGHLREGLALVTAAIGSMFTLRAVQIAGGLILLWSFRWFFGRLHGNVGIWWTLGGLIAGVVVAVLLQPLTNRIAPHNAYRDLLMRCFSIVRRKGGVSVITDARRVKLSELKPPEKGTEDSFPELIICAAANVSDAGASPAGSNVLGISFTPHWVRIPAAHKKMPIEELERYERPYGWKNWGPAVTLWSAVGMTGAAVSPAMGKKTRNRLRALFAALNIRLGVWMPNILRLGTDDEEDEDYDAPNTKTIPTPDKPRLGLWLGSLEVIRELWGFHSRRAKFLYVTDGGHYDNLGLIELLRRRCKLVICIDGSGDRPGRAASLADSILTASGELGYDVDVDLTTFSRVEGSTPPLLEHVHAVGTINYDDGSKGSIVVLKLGMTTESPSELAEYRVTDPVFPHHPTTAQIFRAERFDAYRLLGWATTKRAFEDEHVQALFAPAAVDGAAST